MNYMSSWWRSNARISDRVGSADMPVTLQSMDGGALVACSLEEIYLLLAARLTDRRREMQCQILTRICEIPDELQADAVHQADAVYQEGLRTTVAAVVECVIKAVFHGGDRPIEIPSQVAEQARLAARGGIGVETVLNRYVAGSHVLQGFITEEAQPYPAIMLTRALDLLSSSLPAMVRVAGDAHKAERERPPLWGSILASCSRGSWDAR